MIYVLHILALLDINILWVFIGIVCMSAGAAVVGTFLFLQKRSLIGDTISHAILPGICLAFLFTQTKETWVLLVGAFLSGYIGLISTNYITRKSRLKADAGLGIVLSVFYGFGVLLLTMIQQSGNAAQSGLDKFLFGKAAALLPQDIWLLGGSSMLLIFIILLLFQPLTLMVFDGDYAQAKGLPVGLLEGILSFLTVLSIAIGIQAIGVVLMSALLIAPVVAARYWTDNLSTMVWIAVGIAALAGLGGVWISSQFLQMPTGPWVVVCLSLMSFLSILLGAKKGVIQRWIQHRSYRLKNLEENLLKALYQLGEQIKEEKFPSFSRQQLQERRYLPMTKIDLGLKKLMRKGWVAQIGEGYKLTPEGYLNGERMVRIHRLWELYLTTHLDLPSDHVHDNAEAIEHIITPELEAALEKTLEFPVEDPHQSPIPYRKDSDSKG